MVNHVSIMEFGFAVAIVSLMVSVGAMLLDICGVRVRRLDRIVMFSFLITILVMLFIAVACIALDVMK